VPDGQPPAGEPAASQAAEAGQGAEARGAAATAGTTEAGTGRTRTRRASTGRTRAGAQSKPTAAGPADGDKAAGPQRTGQAAGPPDGDQATRPGRAGQATVPADGGKAAGPARSGQTGGPAGGAATDAGQAGAVTAPFAAPFSAPFAAPAAAPAQPAVDQPGSASRAGQAESAAVPAATFQPPQVIFQQPAASAAPARDTPARDTPVRDTAAREAPAREAPLRDAEPSDDGQPEPEDADADGGNRRRRRRSRSRGRAGDGEPGQDSGQAGDGAAASQAEAGAEALAGSAKGAADADADGSAEADDETGPGGSRKRRRKRRRGSAADSDQAAPDDPPNTVVHVRPARAGGEDRTDEVQVVRGSTRLEAKRQRRKEGRDSGRRRPPVVTESEFLARREAVDRVMVVRQRGDRTQIAVLEDGVLVEHYVDRGSHQSLVGNVYLGKVQNVLPSMEAAFVDIGKGRNAVLYAGEVNFDASGLEGESKRIESALKSGQSVLVQVTKDPVGHKGARLTSQASLPGRYLVYVPGGSMMGISRKLPDTERTRLKQILKQVMPNGAGVIVRTAAEGASEEELAHDVARLSAQWESIEQKAKSASPPELLYSEPDLTIRVVRDIFNEDFARLVVSGEEGWDLVEEYVHYVAPHLSERLEHWQSAEDVFAHYHVDEHLAKALERKVWLPSGGSLVIDNTEAMTVVDVNTGKFTGQGGNLEETVTRNNLEAAEEIVRQLRLRDVGGIIVIDFIDMVLESNRELVLRRLLECLARDRTKHQVAEVTSLGLVQMTRKRVGSGLLEAFSEPCECCNGRGVLISLDGVDHGAHAHRGRQDAQAGNGGKPRDGKAGKDSKWQRQGKADREDKAADRQTAAPAGPAEPAVASAGPAEAAAMLAGEPATAGTAAAGTGTAAGDGAVVPVAEVVMAGSAAADGASTAQSLGGRRRRRAATREPGPPDSATSNDGATSTDEAAGTDGVAGTGGQAPEQASAAAGV
jgi:ribonuclease E